MERKSRDIVGGGTYFHTHSTSFLDRPATAAGGYRGGTCKGLDLTIAGSISSTYFGITTPTSSLLRDGILLRTIQRKSDAVVISGPSLLVNEILRVHGAYNISELVHSIWGGNTMALQSHRPTTSQTNTSCTLSLRPSGSKDPALVYTSSGLIWRCQLIYKS